jgi:hypothetical protein
MEADVSFVPPRPSWAARNTHLRPRDSVFARAQAAFRRCASSARASFSTGSSTTTAKGAAGAERGAAIGSSDTFQSCSAAQ